MGLLIPYNLVPNPTCGIQQQLHQARRARSRGQQQRRTGDAAGDAGQRWPAKREEITQESSKLLGFIYPLVNVYIAIENGHRNSGFSHEKW